MSNQVIVDIRHFDDDDVIVLAEDNYGKTFRSFTPEFYQNFSNVEELLHEIAGEPEMDGSFYIDLENFSVVCEACSSVEVHGFYPPADERSAEVFVYTKDGQRKTYNK